MLLDCLESMKNEPGKLDAGKKPFEKRKLPPREILFGKISVNQEVAGDYICPFFLTGVGPAHAIVVRVVIVLGAIARWGV